MSNRDQMWKELEALQLASKGLNVEEKNLSTNILCARCSSGTVYRRSGSLRVWVFCHTMRRQMPPDLVECSSFEGIKAMSLDEMHKLAINIDKREGVKDGAYI